MPDSRLVIFDWDGTLVDSIGLIVAAMQTAARERGIPEAGEPEVRRIIGLELGEAIRQLYPMLDHRDRDAVRKAYVDAYLALERPASSFFSGVPDMLDDLVSHGGRLAIATGKSRRGLDRAMKGLGVEDFFCATLCADETAGKPDPAMVIELCSRAGVDVGRTPVVGDTLHDLEMAKRARAPAIAVGWGAHILEEMLSVHPVSAARSVQELHAMLLSWWQQQ